MISTGGRVGRGLWIHHCRAAMIDHDQQAVPAQQPCRASRPVHVRRHAGRHESCTHYYRYRTP